MTAPWNNLMATFGERLDAASAATLIGAWICIEPPAYGVHDGRWRWRQAHVGETVRYERAGWRQ